MSTKYIRVCSDLHLEQFRGRDIATLEIDCLPKDDRDVESILVLAGDISSDPDQLVQFIKQVETRFRHAVYVPGNHEFYRHDITTWVGRTKELFEKYTERTSYALDDVQIRQVDGIRFIFGTGWADGGMTAYDQELVGRSLNDFYLISRNGSAFTVPAMIQLNRKMRQDIESALKNSPEDAFNVVVTHHMPSYRLCHPRFGHTIDGGFAFNGDAILSSDHAPDIWIHGHTHDTYDRKLFNSRIVCHPRGYAGEFRHDTDHAYNSYKVEPKFIEL